MESSYVTQIPDLAQIAKEVGDDIAAMQQNIIQNKKWETKPDDSFVTDADIYAHDKITRLLKYHFPKVPVVSEEGAEADNEAALQASERFEMDPLDNTKGYMKGADYYSVNIGRIKDGIPIAGVIYFPGRRELYFTGDDGKAYLQKGDRALRQIRVRSLRPGRPVSIAVGRSSGKIPDIGTRELETQQFHGQYRVCQVACGKCDITGIMKGNEGGFNSWDTAGPHAVLRAAGGDFIATTGEPMRYGNTTRLPDHMAGGIDILVTLNLIDKSHYPDISRQR